MGVDERHYNINKLNRLFAIASLILLMGVGLLVWADYARYWKNYQSEYQNLEIEKTRVKLDDENARLKQNPEYQQLQEELKNAQATHKQQCSPVKLKDTHAKIKNLTSASETRKQQYRVLKGQLDTAKFRYEEAAAHHAVNAKTEEVRYQSLEQKVKMLNRDIEQTDAQLGDYKKILDDCDQALKELQRKERTITKKVLILERKLKKIDPNEMNLTNRLANLFRNLPVVDLANPSYTIKQVVLKDIHDDVNFMTVPKVDRCTTCHLGIDNPDFKDAGQPLTTHPDLELYVSKDSPHPLEDFGCTVCHNGRGRGTDFSGAAHMPSSEKQAEEWKKKYQWEESHHWDKPMYPKGYIEASCFKCHSGQATLKGAEKLNLGLNLIERAGCYACHTIDKYKDWPKPGPDLTHLASKTNAEWSYRWIRNPRSFRHNTWMPSYFGQSNNSDQQSLGRTDQEIHAIVHYLFSESDEFKMKSPMQLGDPQKGEELVAAIGCFGCHTTDQSKTKISNTRDSLKREQGPNLIGFGNKTTKVWLYEWLKDPQRYHPGTRMPNLRLSDEEAINIAAFLSQNKSEEFAAQPIPPLNEKILNDIVAGFLHKNLSEEQTIQKLANMKRDEKLAFAGQKLISQYGCYSCHEIKGFKNYKPIGTELTEEGSKPADKLDFGFVDMEHTKQAWFTQKLHDPRIFDMKKIKTPEEKLRMPNYYFSKEEGEAITTAILGMVKEKQHKIKPRTPDQLAIEQGQRIVRQFNCQGCHMMEGEGGTIRKHITDWLVKYEGKEQSEAEAITTTFSPPDLTGEGKKVQSQWLFDFLHDPSTNIRPWLKVRMPTYSFKASELNSLLKYFNALDQEEFPYTEHVNLNLNEEELVAAHKLFSPDYFDCTKCHIVGDKMPLGSADSWAPDFGLAAKRLKPEWVIDFIKNPSALQPGTKMPTFFGDSDAGPAEILDGNEDEQIRVLRNYIMTISLHPPLPATTTPVAAPAPSAKESSHVTPANQEAGDDFWNLDTQEAAPSPAKP